VHADSSSNPAAATRRIYPFTAPVSACTNRF
jgi:hypothetical protein